MILCVTLNPCLDRTLAVPDWEPGSNTRGTEVREVVGGKGNNVARALQRLGQESRPVTFLGGAVGERCRALWAMEGVADPLVIPSTSPTREILTVQAPATPATAFFDPDPAITPAEADALLAAVDALMARREVDALTLSGSSPSPATHGLFADLIAQGSARGVPVFLDSYGPALAAIWGFWPGVVSLNRREAGIALGQTHPSEPQLFRLLDDWSRRGVRCATVTDGPHAVLARIDGRGYRARPPRIEPINPIGSGDTFLAGMVDAYLRNLGPEATLRRAVAAACANALVWDAGAPDPADVERLEAEVAVEAL